MFEEMQSDFDTSYEKITDAISTIENGFDTHMLKSKVTSCPRNFTFDLGEAGGAAPINTDVCESTSLLYPVIYPLTFIITTVSFAGLILSLIINL